ncbi:MAG: protein-disulfide reductase DsbD [Gammaproteobacteria bacterium]|nr:protein-disulfide reductase DsbD [Gammaproteobacteria bacterium]
MSTALRTFLACLLSLLPLASAFGNPFAQQPTFLPAHEAFVMGVELHDLREDAAGREEIEVFWQVTDGYYLYRHALAFELREAGEAEVEVRHIPEGLATTDEYFGDVEVYYHDLSVRLAIEGPVPAGAVLVARYQGCADAGLCYPPDARYITLTGADAGSISRSPPNGRAAAAPAAPVQAATRAGSEPGSVAAVTREGRLAGLLSGDRLGLALLLFFLAGIGLTFTPCVLPMVPILASIIAGQGDIGRGRAGLLSLVYVLAMALTYALIGLLVGLFGGALNLQGWLQSAPVLAVFAALFVLLALAMFGVYNLELPASLRARLERSGEGGTLGSVAVMGVLSSILVSPCISAPLAGALIYLSASGDAVLGAGALFALGLGMGVPLMVVGVGGASLLPRVGPWMNAVKAAFGVLLLGVAVWLLERVLPGSLILVFWAALAIGSGVALGGFDLSPRSGAGQVFKAAGVMLCVYGILLLVGAASGADDPLRPLERMVRGSEGAPADRRPTFIPVADLDDLRARVSAVDDGRPVLLKFDADWCISCKVMERNLYPHPDVRPLLDDFVLLRADITANDAANRRLLSHFELFGPPSMVFFTPAADGADGELRAYRLQGEVGREDFRRHLQAVLEVARG